MHSPTFDDHRPLVASRRNSLKLIAGGLLSASGVLVACGGGSDSSSATTTDTTSTGGTTGTGGTTTATTTTFNALWIPPLLAGVTTAGVTTYELTLANSAVQYRSGAKTATCGYNGHDFWGPTLLMKKGSTARMQLKNTLAEDTTTHWHGLLVPGPVDGGPHQIVAAGATWLTDAFTVKNNAATYWYHPHLHGMTQKQLTLGAGGFILVQDDAEAALNLPRTYGTDDIPLILTSRRFTTTNGVANQFQTTTTAYGDVMLTNGVLDAQVSLPRQLVRLRILNGEIERDYNLGFSDGRTFYVIGNDGGLLGAPVAVTRLVMAPGERYEILVNLGGDAVGTALDLQSFNGADAGLSFGFAGLENATGGEFGSLLNYRTFSVLRINVAAATASPAASPVTSLPATLVSNTFPTAAEATQARTLVITATGPGAPFTFNNVGFNMNTINQTVTLGATETWTVNGGNIFGHSFHIHGVQFRILARNGSSSAVKAYESGWKDTFYVPLNETVTFVAKFDEAADATYPYMYHCHMVNHEDGGLMGQFVVQ